MEINELKNLALQIAEDSANTFNEVCDTIYNIAETGLNEYESVSYLKKALEGLGFSVTMPYCGLDTAFRAEFGSGSPKIAFLAEYDALPGYGPDKNQNAHACGHNWIAANCFGACAVLSKLKEHFNGTIVYMGCPAEETLGGKVNMVKEGAFDDIDIAMQIHLAGGNISQLGYSLHAIDCVEFTFEGVAAHSASFPERGINALDACYLTFNGINALRQHVTPDARIHGIISEGGATPNIVPSHCVCKFYVRAAEREYLNELTQKVINCAKGAELMTGAKLSMRYFENSFDNHKQHPILQNIMAQNLYLSGEKKECVNTNILPASGSSDIGNVSQVCPTVYVAMAAHNNDGSDCHEENFLPNCHGELGAKILLKAVKAQALTALDLFCSPEIINTL